MKLGKKLAGLVLSATLAVSSISTVLAMNDANGALSGTYGTMPWSASAKVLSNNFTAKFSTAYYCRNVRVMARYEYKTSSGTISAGYRDSGYCTQVAETKAINVKNLDVTKIYSENYIDTALCTTITLH